MRLSQWTTAALAVAPSAKASDADYIRNTTDIPKCHEFLTLVEIEKNTTDPDTAIPPYVGQRDKATKPPQREIQEGQGKPCAVKVDRPTVTSILNEATRLAELAGSLTTELPPMTWPTSTDVGPARTIPTVLVAACVLCGLALWEEHCQEKRALVGMIVCVSLIYNMDDI
ncbi:hypothetical protein VTH82DRAFT_6250 [Thermothelomyces myriococcoides]